jgi:hypothetical protein
MKKLLPLLTILALGTTAKAATVSGTVTNVSTCSPVAGQKVYVADSNSAWKDSAVTNSSGVYSITLPGSMGSSLYAWANACGTVYYNYRVITSGSNVIINLATCGNSSILNGQVSLGSSTTTGLAKVWLIRRSVAPVTFDTTLTAIDSTQTYSSGWFMFDYACVPSGTMLLKAALLPSNPNYSAYLPSYHDSSLNWNGAVPITAANFGVGQKRIDMRAGTNPGGPGFIGGSVLLGANKTAGVGDPLSGRTLILTNAAGKPVAYTTSNAAGKFQFSNLATGSYRLFGDVWGKYDPALTVNITSTQTSVSNIIFEENDKKFEGRFGNVGVSKLASLPGVSVYPNPATDYVSLKGLETIQGDKLIELRDITGRIVNHRTVKGAEASINTSALPSGVYLLQVQTEAGAATFQIVK